MNDSSNEEDIQVSKSKWTKITRKSESQVTPEDSADEFKASDASSDDEGPPIKKSKATVKDKSCKSGRRDAASNRKTNLDPVAEEEEEDRPAAGARITAPSQKANEFLDQSASRAPPTPLDNPRRVGPASRPGGALKRKSGNAKDSGDTASSREKDTVNSRTEGALPIAPKNTVKVQPKGKKRPAEDRLDESPAKRTQSKTVEVLPKRSKKPNSRYAVNFVKC
ncbi:hypothetical protein P692DRAFT_20874381 [Suillus brevipes Sb2]|nr:hypothetical protein P692DRAFT_20874381 [Suillus brevipes Sb2]